MKIETKFNIGETCFYLDCNKVVKDKIMGIEIDVCGKGLDVTCIVGQTSNKNENLVHKTKEELLSSL
jgi:hypothetical protein